MSKSIKNIVIVGGGSAGWLTAGILAADHQPGVDSGVSITLVESPDVSILGVGEGTWPTMRDTLRKMGISEAQFIASCDASFKQGTKFVNWRTDHGSEHYYHPFALPQGYFDLDMAAYWQTHVNHMPFADALSYQAGLCEKGLAPKQLGTPEYAAVANYGYHLNAGKFAQMLQQHCTQSLGVHHIQDHITEVQTSENGDITRVIGQHKGPIPGDLFIDCSGFAAVLIGQHYQVPFVDCKDTLFNDSALAVQVPYPTEQSPIASATVSTAQASGWIWDIGLPTRRGVGYVYSSAHATDQDAEACLRHYIRPAMGELAESATLRKIPIRPGHRARFWQNNCVAVGTSAGFLEPLEASALVLIELSAKMISEQLPAHRGLMDLVSRRFNKTFSYRWQRIIEFLKLHYVLSRRQGSQYWQDMRAPETTPDSLKELLEIWKYSAPSRADFPYIDEVFPAASFQYVLYGMGFETQHARSKLDPVREKMGQQHIAKNADITRQYQAGLSPNRALLDQIKQRFLVA